MSRDAAVTRLVEACLALDAYPAFPPTKPLYAEMLLAVRDIPAAPVENEMGEVERHESYDRTYYPLPGGDEVQTKGKGSTFRLVVDGRRYAVLDEHLHDALEQMAKNIRAAVSENLAKPFPAPGRWFPLNVLGGPMREYAPGKWENAIWPSDGPVVSPERLYEAFKQYSDGVGEIYLSGRTPTDDDRRSILEAVAASIGKST